MGSQGLKLLDHPVDSDPSSHRRVKREEFYRDDAVNITENENQTISIEIANDGQDLYINLNVE